VDGHSANGLYVLDLELLALLLVRAKEVSLELLQVAAGLV